MSGLGRLLVLAGAVLAVVGLLFILGDRFGLHRMPGDLVVRKGRFTLYLPIVSSILLSLILTIVLNLLLRRR